MAFYRTRCFFLVICFLTLVQMVQAQEGGRITGTVRDAQDGALLAGVNVVIVGTLFGTVTDEAGHFEVGLVPPGNYIVQVNALDFRADGQPVTVTAGAETVVDFFLQPPEAEIEAVEGETLRRALQPVADLDARQIREASALGSGDLLRLLPGVDAGRRGPFSLHPQVRGLFENQLGLYVDGARLLQGSPYGIGAPLDYYDPRALESIEVVKGPYALTWGAGNLSAIRVVTRGNSPVNHPLASVQGGYISNLGGLEAVGAASAGRSGVTVWGQGVYRSGNDYKDGKGVAVPADFQVVDLRGQVGYTPGIATRLNITAGYRGQRDLDMPGRLLNAEASNLANTSGRFQAAWSTGLVRGLDVTAYWNRLDQTLTDAEKPGGTGQFGIEAEHTMTGGRVAAQTEPAEAWVVDVGIDGYSARYDAIRKSLIEDQPALDARTTLLGVFVSTTRSFGQFLASATVRVDAVQAEGRNAGGDLADGSETNLSSALAVSTPLGENWQVGMGIGSAVRTADAVERYGDKLPLRRAHRVALVQGNPDLAPERSTQADLWIDATLARFDLHLSVFARRLNDFITITPTDFDRLIPPQEGPVDLHYLNGEAMFWGVETTADYALFGRYVTLHGQASYVWGRDEVLGEPALGVAPFSGTLGWRVQGPGNLFFLEGALHLVAAQNRVAVSRGESSTSGYAATDFRLGVSGPRSSSLVIGLDNLTGTSYANHLNAQDPFTQIRLPEPSRTFYARFRVLL